jgi:murein DD-endopeptidase MepM/ murein hydrolase activator NlpD
MRAQSLVLIVALTLLAVPSSGQKQGLIAQPMRPKQGEAVLIRLADSGAQEPTLTWRGETYRLYLQGEEWIGGVAVSPDTPAGGHTITVNVAPGHREQVRIQVQPVKFPVQYLRMAKKTARLYNFPGAKREDAAVNAALRTRSERRLWSGDWVLPAKGPLSTRFGVRRLRNGRPVGRHRGLDIAAADKSPVVAPAAARVVLAAPHTDFKKYGGTVILDHGAGVTSFYIHMSSVMVKKGQTVSKGTQIGRVGGTGVATGPHLHWAAYVNATSIEPTFFCRLSKMGIDF